MSSVAANGQSQVLGAGKPVALGGVKRWFLPSLADCLFVSMVVWLFMVSPDGWSRLLLDGDTGWHIRAGEYVLDQGSVPTVDLFSFSKAGQEWFAWEWGADIIYAGLHRAMGLKGIVLLAAGLIAFYTTLLFRYSLWRGSTALLSLGITLMAVAASSLHYLARPHLATLVLVPATMWIIERDRRLADGDRWLWSLIPITAVWTNLHGGFMAIIACSGLLALGTGIETLLSGTSWKRFQRYSILTVACGAASVVNPYGINLHRHIVAYLQSDFIRDTIQEFQSPRFRNENILQFEVLMLVSLLLGWRFLANRRITEVLWILFWAHQALSSVRHVTIFVTIAAPLIASEVTTLWHAWVVPASRKSIRKILDGLSNDMGAGFAWNSVWPMLFLLALVFIDSPIRWPKDFPKERFPLAMVERHLDRIKSARVLTTDQWADYLIYRNYPSQRVFFDGRSDFYGPEVGKEYMRVSAAQYDWNKIMTRYQFNLVLIPMDWALGSVLKQDHNWRILEDDGKTLLFQKVGVVLPPPVSAPAKKAGLRLMELPDATEFLVVDLMASNTTRPGTARSGFAIENAKLREAGAE